MSQNETGHAQRLTASQRHLGKFDTSTPCTDVQMCITHVLVITAHVLIALLQSLPVS